MTGELANGVGFTIAESERRAHVAVQTRFRRGDIPLGQIVSTVGGGAVSPCHGATNRITQCSLAAFGTLLSSRRLARPVPPASASACGDAGCRSEERRVGKECRSRWSP